MFFMKVMSLYSVRLIYLVETDKQSIISDVYERCKPPTPNQYIKMFF